MMFAEGIHFEKVPFEFYESAVGQPGCGGVVKQNYSDIPLPKRGTRGRAGYDFYADKRYTIEPGSSAIISTGICAYMPEEIVLLLFPRSGLAFNHSVHLANDVAVIDSDFVNGKTHGHILVKLVNEGKETLYIEKGSRFCQGVFMPYLVTDDDDAIGERVGGVGSTGT